MLNLKVIPSPTSITTELGGCCSRYCFVLRLHKRLLLRKPRPPAQLCARCSLLWNSLPASLPLALTPAPALTPTPRDELLFVRLLPAPSSVSVFDCSSGNTCTCSSLEPLSRLF